MFYNLHFGQANSTLWTEHANSTLWTEQANSTLCTKHELPHVLEAHFAFWTK